MKDLGLIAMSSTTSKMDILLKCKHKYCFPVVGKVISFHRCISETSSSVCFGQREFFSSFFSTESFIICIKHVLFTMFSNEQALIHPRIILNIVKWTYKKGLCFNNKY